jgi:hypothetical protein
VSHFARFRVNAIRHGSSAIAQYRIVGSAASYRLSEFLPVRTLTTLGDVFLSNCRSIDPITARNDPHGQSALHEAAYQRETSEESAVGTASCLDENDLAISERRIPFVLPKTRQGLLVSRHQHEPCRIIMSNAPSSRSIDPRPHIRLPRAERHAPLCTNS